MVNDRSRRSRSSGESPSPNRVSWPARVSRGNLMTLAERVAQYWWYHRIELPGGIVTPGRSPICADAYRLPPDLTGKRVLDVGAWDGYWTFEALKRGALYVMAIDDYSDPAGEDWDQPHPGRKTFDLCREALGYGPARIERREMSAYDCTPETVGYFDVVLAYGVLYHMRHPMLFLDRMAALCRGQILVESAILDHYSPYQGGLQHGYPGLQMLSEFYPKDEYGSVATNWWVPTLCCMMHMLGAAGFHKVKGWKLTDKPTHLAQCRGFAEGFKDDGKEG